MAGGYSDHHAGCYKDLILRGGATGETWNTMLHQPGRTLSDAQIFPCSKGMFVDPVLQHPRSSIGGCGFGWHYISHSSFSLVDIDWDVLRKVHFLKGYVICGFFTDLRGCCFEPSLSAKHQESYGGGQPQAAQGVLGVSSPSLWPTHENSFFMYHQGLFGGFQISSSGSDDLVDRRPRESE